MDNKYDLTIYLLTYKRNDMCIEALKCILSQTFRDFYIVISDNNDNLLFRDVLEKEGFLQYVIYRNRNDDKKHQDTIINEVETPYFMMLHDDDLIMPNMIENLYKRIREGDYSCVACNAYIMVETKENVYRTFIKTTNDITIYDNDDLIKYYLPNSIGIAPFPAYMYSKKAVEGKRMYRPSTGKYSDVVLISECLQSGMVLWVGEPLMYYRFHKNQDSHDVAWKEQQHLFNYFFTHSRRSSTKVMILKAKFIYFIRRMKQSGIGKRMLEFEYKQVCKRIKKLQGIYPEVYIYGCGDVGKRCLNILQTNGIDIKGFFVSNNTNVNEKVYGLPVEEYSDEIMKNRACCVVLGLGKKNYREVLSRKDVKQYRKRVLVFSRSED